MSIININQVFYLIGIIVLLVAVMSWRDASNPRRHTTALFWLLFGFTFVFGDLMVSSLGKPLAYKLTGVIVLVLAALAGFHLLGAGKHVDVDRAARLQRVSMLGNRLFIPALAIPLVTVIFTVALKDLQIGSNYLLDQKNLTLAALAIACMCALGLAYYYTGGTPLQAVRESRRLVDSIGWALILPQMLAMLGGVFVAARTGQSIQSIVQLFVNPDSRFALIIMYCVGMALFTMIMGNAFAAFPVMTAGIALPFLINQHHANPAALVAIGMFSGYCGTLMTPMAANFNIVPAALLELQDKYQVIKIQVPTALLVLICNILLIHFLVFP
ncbi:DUF979 domain-containing protein [Undibacterium sp. TS12]|uniref:DUF979 domain-containing protein n=1 Tax=Undibacterium sp. TS12 TaxID=2908202 RepID=UPI001F4CBD0C|nr:DUF979 domain-containing protein [Undibacterium sp. TS12]MCH8619447.1 DUF979 domain-containing protein [Undibacterium sp. TS12]